MVSKMCKRVLMFSLLTFIFFSVTDALKLNCNRNEDLLQRCLMALPILISPNISLAITREELNKSCIELNVGIKCIDNYTNTCMEKHEQIVFRRIFADKIDVVQELCMRGKYQDEYLKHADCVKKVRSEYETCSRKYEETQNNHHQSEHYETDQVDIDVGVEEYLKRKCCSYQKYLMCSEQTVQRSCGDEAALFTSAFLKRKASNIIKEHCLEYRREECGLTDGGDATTNKQSLNILGVAILIHFAHNFVPRM